MIVVDSSAAVHALAARRPNPDLMAQLAAEGLHAPHLLDTEVMNTLRGLLLAGKISLDKANDARAEFAALHISRYAMAVLADRVWDLRHSMTAYDASYVALAEALDCPLVTCDAKLGGPDSRAVVTLYR